MANTFIKIAAVTVGSGGASSIDFTSIPSTYTDLCVLVSARIIGSGFSTPGALYVNTNLTTYSQRYILGDGGSASSGSNAFIGMFGTVPNTGYTANTFGSASIYIPNYAGSTFKSVSSESVSETNGTTAYAMLNAGLISSTGAITSISLASDGPFVQYSTATLYGIKKN
jgi:hypothetical protein